MICEMTSLSLPCSAPSHLRHSPQPVATFYSCFIPGPRICPLRYTAEPLQIRLTLLETLCDSARRTGPRNHERALKGKKKKGKNTSDIPRWTGGLRRDAKSDVVVVVSRSNPKVNSPVDVGPRL